MTSSSGGNKYRIFIIEDNHKYVELVTRALISDYHVSCTDTADKGIELCKAFVPDIILLDINLTGNQSGIDLLKSIKSDESLAYLPVLIMSGISSSEIISDSLKYGANDYIVKPFEINHLIYKIKNLLSVCQSSTNTVTKESLKSTSQTVYTRPSVVRQISSLDDEAIKGGKKLNIEEICKKLGISQSTINRAIKKEFGITTQNYLMKRRLEKAKLIVVSNQWKQIGEIAYEFGFDTSSYFCKAFKKQFGCSPSEMRLL